MYRQQRQYEAIEFSDVRGIELSVRIIKERGTSVCQRRGSNFLDNRKRFHKIRFLKSFGRADWKN